MNNNSTEFTHKLNSIYERFKDAVRQSETVSTAIYAGMAVGLPLFGAGVLGQWAVGGPLSQEAVDFAKVGTAISVGVSVLTYSAIVAAKWAINANDAVKEQEALAGRSGAVRWTPEEIKKYKPELLSETERNYSKEKLKQFTAFQDAVFAEKVSPFRHSITSELEHGTQKDAVGAQAELARRYLMELNSVQYAEKAVELFKGEVKKGSADAALWLGKMHLEGFGVDKDVDKGWALLTLASQRGSAGAAYTMGMAHQKGEAGATKSYIEAERYLERAVELGSSQAKPDLHFLRNIMTALSVESKNLNSLKESTLAGDPQAHFELGQMYLKGTQVDADPDAAMHHFKQAAAMDHAESVSMLSTLRDEQQHRSAFDSFYESQGYGEQNTNLSAGSDSFKAYSPRM